MLILLLSDMPPESDGDEESDEDEEGRRRPEKHRLGESPVRLDPSGSLVNLGESSVRHENVAEENIEAVEKEVVVEEDDSERNEFFEQGNFGVLMDEVGDSGLISWIRRSLLNRDDIECLKSYSGEISWLNDAVIMNYLICELPKIDENVLIVEIDIWYRDFVFPEHPRALFFPIYNENWSQIVFPINVSNNHWVLTIVNREGIAEFYDSMKGTITERQMGIVRGIMSLLGIENVEFRNIDRETYYQQNNTHSCGPAVCMLAERRLKNENLKFIQAAVNQWRKKAFRILDDEITKNWDLEEENVEEEVTEEVEEEDIVVVPKMRKRKKAPLTLKGAKIKQRKSLKKHRDSLTEKEKDSVRKKDADNKREKRKDPEFREKEADAKMKKRNAERKKGLETTAFLARTPIENENKVPYFDIGDLTDECKHCGARYFEGERKSGNPKGKYNECCNSGNIKLDNAFENYPEKLYYLFAKDHELKPDGTKTEERRKGEPKMFWVLFHEKIRNNNSAFAFASMSADQDVGAMPTYKIHGQVYHTVNMAAIPDPGEKPSYAQLFIVDSKEALDYRMEHKANKGCDRDLLEAINEILNEVGNPYIESFKIMAEVMQGRIKWNRGT
jgi:hypothetical protein